jgi:hypothetical protein
VSERLAEDAARTSGFRERRWFGTRLQIWLGGALALLTIYLAARGVDCWQC